MVRWFMGWVKGVVSLVIIFGRATAVGERGDGGHAIDK